MTQSNTQWNTSNDALWHLANASTTASPSEIDENKNRKRYNSSNLEHVVKNFETLTFPCYALYRAIGVRMSRVELERYAGNNIPRQRDIARKRGINKYFRCILWYKGDLDQTCSFGDNIQRRCNFFVQFYENPSDHMNQPPSQGWGALRPVLSSTIRGGAADVVQNYEYNLEAPLGSSTVLIPNIVNGGFPNILTWNEYFSEAEIRPTPNYEWNDMDETKLKQRHGYRLRPLSNVVTNCGLHLFIIEGTGGKRFLDYNNSQLHSALTPKKHQYILTLQRISILSDQANRIRFDMLTSGSNPKLIQYPPGIRRFAFHGDKASKGEPLAGEIPLFERKVTPGTGLLDIAEGKNRFLRGQYSYPSIPLEQYFQDLINMAHRQNVIQAQVVSRMDYMSKPLFISQVARNRFSESAHHWAKEADRVLKRNQSNPEIEQIIKWLKDRSVGYGPLDL
jgi:hypothetical protein